MKATGRLEFPLVTAALFGAALVAVGVLQVVGMNHTGVARKSDSTGALAACSFWASGTPPSPATTSFAAPKQQAPALDLGARLPAPTGIMGRLTSGRLVLTLDHVPGAQAYRAWRNAEPLATVVDHGQSNLTITDPRPCRHAFYTVVALRDQSGTDAASGQLSRPYQLATDGTTAPWTVPDGSPMKMMVSSYSTGGQAASGYNTRPGLCSVDPRVIPWGIYFYVPDYGFCYSADVGAAVQDNSVAVWLPGGQATGWGVQDRTITLGTGPARGSTGSTPSASPSPSPSASASPSPKGSPSPASAAGSPRPAGGPAGGPPAGGPPTQPAPTAPPAPFSASYEAESAALSGGARAVACWGCSGTQKAGYIGLGGTAQFAFSVPGAGSYRLSIAYVDGDAGRTLDVSVDGGGAVALACGNSGGWNTPATRTITVTLNAGANTIRLSNPSAMAPDVDAISLTRIV